MKGEAAGVPTGVVLGLRRLGVATVYEASGRRGLVEAPLERVVAGSRAAGPARTVLCGQGDNLAVHAALARVQPGEVLVLAMPKESNAVGEEDLRFAEEALEEWRGKTEIPREFVVPGESRLGALLDVARTVVRRSERSLVAAGYETEHPYALRAVNRLSDLLFVVARNADGRRTLSKD